MVGTDLVTLVAPSALAYKVLSPSADLFGKELEGWTERRLHNLRNITATLEHKYGVDEVIEGPAQIAPRLLRGLLDEGSYIEDEVGSEYFGGVLAGSRSEDGGDDNGVPLMEVMNGLSSLQLRAHYVLYRAAQEVFAERDVEVEVSNTWEHLARIAISTEACEAAIVGRNVDDSETPLGTLMRGLKRNDLIDAQSGWMTGPPEELHDRVRPGVGWPYHSLVFNLTAFGMELFCAAHGFTSIDAFKRPTSEFRPRFKVEVSTCEALIISELPPSAGHA